MNTPSQNKKTSSPAVNYLTSGIQQGSHSSRQSFRPSQYSKYSRIGSVRGSIGHKARSQSNSKPTRKTIKVLDSDGFDVTPLPLYHAETGDIPAKPGTLFLDEIFSSSGSEYSKSTFSSNTPIQSISQQSSQFGKALLHFTETEGTLPKPRPINTPAPCNLQKEETETEEVTEEMLDEVVDICLSDTDTISLLDIPSSTVSEDAEDAEATKQKNVRYVQLCQNRTGNDKYVMRSMQTSHGANKIKKVQSDEIVMVDKGTTATNWDIYDSFCEQTESAQTYRATNTSSRPEKVGKNRSSTVDSDSSVSSLLSSKEMCLTTFTEPDPQLMVLSESFRHSLLVMERNVVANIFQSKLASYRQLPILEDPDSIEKPGTEECEESSSSPTLELLWAFSCELTRGCNITCMTWNKENKDILAVGYGDHDSMIQKPSFICCWSLKNPTWPERVFNCHSCVTALSFSANNPSQLAVGMFDGTVAIYNVQRCNTEGCIVSSSQCSRRHLHPVWQVVWTQMKRSLQDQEEALVSVSSDGRISKWKENGSNGLDAIDLMKLKDAKQTGKMAAADKQECEPSQLIHGLDVAFHPTDLSIYLVGTWEGLIYECSLYKKNDFLKTYQKHFCPVSHIEWSPFSPDMFLSCSFDWTIQLWRRDLDDPVLSFTSTQTAVHAIKWSPNWPTMFAAIHSGQLEIWDLKSSILQPAIVHPAAPGVRLTSLLFARGTDCVLVGDSVGRVSVYRLKHLRVGDSEQVDSLEDIIHAAAPV